MFKPIIGSTKFYELLAKFDRDLAADVQAEGCPNCASRLDVAKYDRKPRGVPENLPAECRVRNSLCCRREGCRKRRKPPSVLFLERRVYTATAVVLVSALTEGATPRRMKTLRNMIGASAKTLVRWRQWWREMFPESDTARRLRARMAEGLDMSRLPRSLLECVLEPLLERVAWVLLLLAGQHSI